MRKKFDTLSIIGKNWLFLVLFVLVGCKTTEDEQKSEFLNFGEEQLALSNIINERVQIYNVDFKDGFLSLTLKNHIFSIDTHTFPYVCQDMNGNWTINGEVVSGNILSRSKGDSSFPVLSISPDGFLLVNGIKSHFNWNSTLVETISSNDKWIWALAQIDSYLCIYYGDENIRIPIVDSPSHIIPYYFFDLVVEKERKAENIVEDLLPEEQLSYVFFTDAHWGANQKHSPAIIKHIVDYTTINHVLFGGDANTSRTDTPQGTITILNQFSEAFSFLGSRLYCLFGNHDDNSTGQSNFIEKHLTEEQVFTCLQSQMTDVHFGDYYNFYFDEPKSKTRFICLDTGRFYEPAFLGKMNKTARFVIESLSQVPDGWHVIVASHIWLQLTSFETGEAIESPVIRPIIEILENYNLRTKSSYSNHGETIEYDFSNSKATVEYCIGGHIHADAYVTSQKGIPLITIACDGEQEVAGNVPHRFGTVSEQCVTIVTNDYKQRKVNILHIGRGNDISFDMWN